MSTETTRTAEEAALRREIAETLVSATDTTQATTALMRVFTRHQNPAVWTPGKVQDLVSSITRRLQLAGVPVGRDTVEKVLAAAGITPGEVR